MRKFIHIASIAAGVLLTAWAVKYAYAQRGYFAIGSEYVFMFLPCVVSFAEFIVDDIRGERARWL